MRTIIVYICLFSFIYPQTSNIDPTEKYAWGTNVGWINFLPSDGGVTIYTDHLEGYAWSENVGWIRLGTYNSGGSHTYENTSNTNYGINNDGEGNLSGYAWGTNVGWINFNPSNGGVAIAMEPAGAMSGYAWAENIGWIHFANSAAVTYQVATITDNSLPVELAWFKARQVNTSIVLEWNTASETENLGFMLHRCIKGEEWAEIAGYEENEELLGSGSVTSSSNYSFIDKNVEVGYRYEYRLSDMDYAGKIQQIGTVAITPKHKDERNLPDHFTLYEVYPNPFNPSTTISYFLPEQSDVNLTVLDIRGQEVMTLQDEVKIAGSYEVQWSGMDQSGNPVSTGVYFCRLEAGSFSQTIKMVYL